MDRSEWKPKNVPGIVDECPEILEEYQNYFPSFRKIPDYCPIRHRVAIMRVLHAINGNGLLLNSAARMWTVAQVAIHLEVTNVVVSNSLIPNCSVLMAVDHTDVSPSRLIQ